MARIEKRASARLRTRLRPGRLFGPDGRFLCDCAIRDRTAAGARVGLFPPKALAKDIVLFDESDCVRRDARLVWSSSTEAGLSFASLPAAVEAQDLHRFAGRYYALDG